MSYSDGIRGSDFYTMMQKRYREGMMASIPRCLLFSDQKNAAKKMEVRIEKLHPYLMEVSYMIGNSRIRGSISYAELYSTDRKLQKDEIDSYELLGELTELDDDVL